MTITIEPYTVENNLKNSDVTQTYWGVYLDDREISTTSTKEQAENTKKWMESWLENKH